jgi:hypothetical protein
MREKQLNSMAPLSMANEKTSDYSSFTPMTNQAPKSGGRYNSKGQYVFPKDSVFYDPQDDSDVDKKAEDSEEEPSIPVVTESKNDIFTRPISPVLPPKGLQRATKAPGLSITTNFRVSQPLCDRLSSIKAPQALKVPISTHHVLESPTSKAMSLNFLPTSQNLLGEGRYARVYRGTYICLSESSPTRSRIDPKPCAIKKFHQNPECQAVALAEVYVLRKLVGHPNIVDLIAVKDDNEMVSAHCYQKPAHGNVNLSSTPELLVVLEYCKSGSVGDYIEKNPSTVGKRLWFKWAKQLTSAIFYMQLQGVIHHDIKPHNIMVRTFSYSLTMAACCRL